MLQLHHVLFGLLIAYGVHTCNGLRPRIIDGSKARLGEFPYQVVFQVMNETLCGGVIIDKYHALTAAHCLERFKPGFFNVLVGTVDLNSTTHPGVWHKVAETKAHEKYKSGDGWPNDIAVLRLEKPIAFNEYVKPAVLPKSGEELKSGQSAMISGFGMLKPDASLSPVLYKTLVVVEDNRKCQIPYHNNYPYHNIRPTNFCTTATRVTGTCGGDSGGPITVDGKVVGVASFALRGCAEKNDEPQVHTRISEYVDWIDSRVK